MNMDKIGYLVKTRKEKFNSKRSWFVNAYRVVTDEDVDWFLPWAKTKKEARDVCKKIGITLVEKD